MNELRQLREENAKLKRLVADLSLDGHILQEIVQKSFKASLGGRLPDAQERLESWRQDYNQVGPHIALCDRAPEELASYWQTTAAARAARASGAHEEPATSRPHLLE